MSKIYVNNNVFDRYRAGMDINSAINAEFGDVIAQRVKENPELEKLSPLNIVMRDAGINKYSTVGDIMNTAAYTTTGAESNQWLFPAWVSTTLQETAYAQDVLSYLVTASESVDGNVVKAASLDLMNAQNKKAIKKARVSELADLPLAKIAVGEKAITLWKHGRALEASYESIRRMRIDLLTKHMNAIAQDIAQQGFEDAVDVALNGDGNNNAAASLGTFTAGITAEELMGFLIDYWADTHMVADTITVGLAGFKKLAGMTFNSELVPGASHRISFNLPQIGSQNLTILYADMPKVSGHDVMLLTNKANTLQRFVENGSMVNEVQNFIQRQSRMMTFSENSGYAIMTNGTNKTVNLA